MALEILWNTPKYIASESELRDFLKNFSIPEQRVYTIKRRGTKTWYSLPKTAREEKELKNRLKEYDMMNKIEIQVLKIVRKLVPKTEGVKINCFVLNLEKSTICKSANSGNG